LYTVSVRRLAHVEVLLFAAVLVVEDHLVVVPGHHDARALDRIHKDIVTPIHVFA
jgi:hypothetical protein